MKTKLFAATVVGGAVLLSTVALSGTAVATGSNHGHGDNKVAGRLNTLNNSGVTGDAHIKVQGKA
jgi:hypothetical protein